MITNISKRLALACLVSAQLLTYSTAFAKSGGAIAGGGGDATEERVNEIRADILKWINKEGAKDLVLPASLSYGEYVSKMTNILQPKKVVIGFVEKDDSTNEELQVSVNGMPKTCRGFISRENSKFHILCNIARFKNTSDSEQYKLIHHEYAGLVSIENNEAAASDYVISSQITEYLSLQTVLRLAVKTQRNEQDEKPEMVLTKNKYLGNKMFEVEYTLKNSDNVMQVTLQNNKSRHPSKFPTTVLRNESFSFKTKVKAGDEYDFDKDFSFENVIVQYTDGALDLVKPIQYKTPILRFNYKSAIYNKDEKEDLEDVVKFKQVSEETVIDKSNKFKLKHFKMGYEITLDTSAIDLSQYRGVIIQTYGLEKEGEIKEIELMSENPLELEKFIKSQKINLSFLYEQQIKYTRIGCFEITDEIGSCLVDSQSADNAYHVRNNFAVGAIFISKDDVSSYKVTKLKLPKIH